MVQNRCGLALQVRRLAGLAMRPQLSCVSGRECTDPSQLWRGRLYIPQPRGNARAATPRWGVETQRCCNR